MATARANTTRTGSKELARAIGDILVEGALPGETDRFGAGERREAAAFILENARVRRAGKPNVALDTFAGADSRRHMRLAIVNDDMPFLVDSIAGALAAQGVAIDRILHPVAPVARDAKGDLLAIGEGDARESMIYVEAERADARTRRAIGDAVETALAHVRAAVRDWGAMQDAMRGDADTCAGEGRALLQWFLDRNFTLLGHAQYDREGGIADALGISGAIGDGVLAPQSRETAVRWFEAGNDAPLLIKSNFISTVHRRVPIDLVIVPIKDGRKIAGLSIHAGLWTSAALNAAPQTIPVLRARLAELEEKYKFDPRGHAGKALSHALTALPHDLLTGMGSDGLERLALTAMSLADRPRPLLRLVAGPLKRHLFAFVWLPRDELSTARRVAIGDMLAEAANGSLLNWTIDLGASDVALIRYTFDLRDGGRSPDEQVLDRRIELMVRGWAPAVEAGLAALGDGGSATRLALRYAAAFPLPYRNGAGPDEAAVDITRLHLLADATSRNARLYRNAGDGPAHLRLKLYSLEALALSDVVPALENFGFRAIEELTTALDGGRLGHIQKFILEMTDGAAAEALLARADIVEGAIADVLEGVAENDRFNQLIIATALEPRWVVLLRALFRYLRQTGLSYGLTTVVDALRRAPGITNDLIALFQAGHDPAGRRGAEDRAASAERAIERALLQVAAIDDDRILRLFRAVILATLRTNFFAPSAREAIALKIDSPSVPGLPAPVPWREIFVYSPRVEGIHLRAGAVARGGLRWSDRRDDFRTEILGLMKAQRVKNAVIVPTGAKGGFYPKRLPDPALNREAWLAEGTESYRIFIRSLLSVTDNIVDGKVVDPKHVVGNDGDDAYFVVAADKGTAAFSDVANAIAMDRGFWLGDAFASGGSVGYDHKAMGITAKGAWVSVQRHFAEAGVDVQSEPVRVVGCGDMSGDVFGNGMLLSKAIKLVAAFDHRHIFIDPDPDPAASWEERARMFALPRSSWADYDTALISRGGGVWPRTTKSIKLSRQAREVLGVDAASLDPSALISAILKSPADLIWFGGIGTYVKARAESNNEVGDTANDAHRVNAEDIHAKVIGEGANLGITQAARIVFAGRGGRINTDFIDNSAGVDCSDNEVNIKIALNAEVAAGRLAMPRRNALLERMTDDVAALVLEDNRLQTLALSLAERAGVAALPAYVRLIEIFESTGKLDRAVEGLVTNDELLRRAAEQRGLTRPELAVLLSTAKLALQEAIEATELHADPEMLPELMAAFPAEMQRRQAQAIAAHQLRREIIATKVANRMVNRLGMIHPIELAEEEGASLGDVAEAFLVVERLHDAPAIWAAIDEADITEDARLMLFEQAAVELRAHMADMLRNAVADRTVGEAVVAIRPGFERLSREVENLLPQEARIQTRAFATRLIDRGAPKRIAERIVRLAEVDGVIGLATLGSRRAIDEIALTRAFVRLGEALGIDWAQGAAMRLQPSDPWERLLAAGLARDFQAMRLDFLAHHDGGDPQAAVEDWLARQAAHVAQFKAISNRARATAVPSTAMLAQIAGQARSLLGRS